MKHIILNYINTHVVLVYIYILGCPESRADVEEKLKRRRFKF